MTERIAFPKSVREKILNHLLGRCSYCGIELDIFNSVIEHQFPLCKGGTNERFNLVPSCNYCNSRKGRKSIYEFWQILNNNPDIEWLKRAGCNYQMYSLEDNEYVFHFYYEYAYDQDLYIPLDREDEYAKI
jgi:hypothetical protein